MFTDEQLKMIMEMPDFSGEEANLARQGQMAQSLRQYGRGGGNDTGSNVARALGGIGGAMGDYMGAQGTTDLGARRRAEMQRIFGGGGAVPPAGMA